MIGINIDDYFKVYGTWIFLNNKSHEFNSFNMHTKNFIQKNLEETQLKIGIYFAKIQRYFNF